MLCSLCIFECNETNSISLFGGEQETGHWKMIAKHMQIELACGVDDGESKVICSNCAKHLDDFCSFCRFIEERQKFLMVNTLAQGEIPIDESRVKELYVTENNSIIEECASGSNYNNKDAMAIKDEDEESSSSHNESIVKDDTGNTIELNNDLEHTEQQNPIDDDDDEEDDDIPLNDILEDSKIEKKTKTKLDTSHRKSLTTAKRKNIRSPAELKTIREKKAMTEGEIHEKIIKKNITIKCEICNALEDTFMKLQTHYRLKHGCKGYLKCCGKVFGKRHRLADHIKLHLNPEAFQCEICKKSLHSKYYLRRHIEDRHSNVDEKKFTCELCGRKFANKTTFQVHCKSHEKTKLFKCDRCDKTFKHKNSLEGHIRNIHEEHNNPYICDICGRSYRFKPSFDNHVAEHKGIVLRVPKTCEICGESYARYDRHMDKHNHVDVTCSICGKVSTSKAGLRGHIEKKHRQSTKEPTIYSCTFCEKTFKRKKSLKEHITIHTDEKLYSCKYCDREFRSNANMYTHTKRAHAELWLQAKQDAANKKIRPQTSTSTESSSNQALPAHNNFENT